MAARGSQQWSDDLIHWKPCAEDEPQMLPPPIGTSGEFLTQIGPAAHLHRRRLMLLLHHAHVQDDGSVCYTCGQLLIDPATDGVAGR